MTERDNHLPEGFLVDGVAPPVIGGEGSPVPDGDDYEPPQRREPPTTPIPAQRPVAAPQPPEQRKGWLGRMFGRD